MSGRYVAICVALAALALVPAVATVADAPFYTGLFARISDFGAALNLDRPVVFYYFAYGLLLLFLFLGNRIVQSRFGMLLQGVKSNERRMIALGFPTFRYKLTAFVMAGAVCGIAGALFANLTLFVSPSIMHWTRSGEIMMMVILGGVGPLVRAGFWAP